jgi:hypothetical protein
MELMFSGLTGLKLGSISDMTLDRYVGRQTDNIGKMVTYYNNNYFPVKGKSPFVRLLTSFSNYGIEATPLDYYNRASSLIQELCFPVGIANSINSGFPHDGLFFGDKTICQLVYSDFISISTIIKSDWKELEPIRVLRRDGTDDPMRRPDLIEKGDGLVVVGVDVAALAYMYKNWSDEQLKKPFEDRLNDYNFLGRIVYPNMIWSGVYSTYIYALCNPDVALKQNDFATNLSIIDYSYRLIDQLKSLLGKYNERSSQTSQILSAIPLFDKDDKNKTAIDRLPEIKDRVSAANAYISFLIAYPLSTVCLNNTLKSPVRTTVLNDKENVVRYFRNQRSSAKITDIDLKDIYVSDFKKYSNINK